MSTRPFLRFLLFVSVSAIVGLLAIRVLLAYVRTRDYRPFVYYRWAFAAMLVINRKYAEVLFEHTTLLLGTLVSMGIGIWWIRKIVNFET